MKVVRWVYNALNRFVGRVEQIMMTNLAIAIGTMLIPVGLIIIITAKISPNTPQSLFVIGLVVGGIGVISLIRAMFRANLEDKEREYHTRLFEALVSKMGVDVEKIRNSREDKKLRR